MWSCALPFPSSLSMFLTSLARKCPNRSTLLVVRLFHLTFGLPGLVESFVSCFFYFNHFHYPSRTDLCSLNWSKCTGGKSETPWFLNVAKGNDRFGLLQRVVFTMGQSSDVASSQTCSKGWNIYRNNALNSQFFERRNSLTQFLFDACDNAPSTHA